MMISGSFVADDIHGFAVIGTRQLKPKQKEQNVFIAHTQQGSSSVYANIREVNYGQSKADMLSKFAITLKEASETGYWLELLYRTKYIDEQTFKTLSSKCTSLRVMLIESCKIAKKNAKRIAVFLFCNKKIAHRL